MSMKKVVCILIVVLMCMNGLAVALAELELRDFDLNIIPSFDYSQAEWVESEYNRSLLTVGLLMDFFVEHYAIFPDGKLDVKGDSYIGYLNKGYITVCVELDEGDDTLCIVYIPSENEKTASYIYLDGTGTIENFNENLMASLHPDGYCKNNVDSILEALDVIGQMISDE